MREGKIATCGHRFWTSTTTGRARRRSFCGRSLCRGTCYHGWRCGRLATYGASPRLARAFPRHEATDGLAVHPSGRVALAVGRVGGLAMLNLVRGRRSFACRLERPASAVAYVEDGVGGDRFMVAAEEKVTVHDSEDARIIHEMDCGKRVLSFGPAKNGVLYTGGEDRGITAWDLSSGKVSSRIEDAHSTRVKGIAIFDNRNDGSELCNLIASASSGMS